MNSSENKVETNLTQRGNMQVTFKVYLSGTMTDLVKSESGEHVEDPKQRVWREKATEIFAKHGVQTLNPYRGKDRDKIKKVGSYLFSESSKLIRNSVGSMLVTRDFNDIQQSDIVLANMTGTKGVRPSIGTISELAWSYMLHKPVVCVIDETTDENYFKHPFMHVFVHQWTKTVEEGIEAILSYWHPLATPDGE